MQTLYDYGYAIWCQRGQCYRCKDTHCECLHHKTMPDGLQGKADPEIVAMCMEWAVQKGSLKFRCQMGQHKLCKQSRCNCKCHGMTAAPPIVQEDLPIASEANVLKLQEHIQAAEATITNTLADVSGQLAQAYEDVKDAKQALGASIKEFDQRIATLEKAKKVEIKIPGKAKPVEVGVVHKDFEELVQEVALQDKGAVYLVGPAGGGKTHIARQIHLALGRKPKNFFSMSVGLQTTQAQIMGYASPTTGECYHSAFFNTFTTKDATMLVDEADAANAGVFTSANGVMANDFVQFGCNCPIQQRAEGARFIVAANTFGKGADHLYVGRNQLDAATLNRFTWFPLDYDWDLVKHYTGDIDGFTTYVSRLYECAAELKLRVVIGPRQADYGCKRLAAGQDRERVEFKVLWAAMDTDDKNKILEMMKRKYPTHKCKLCPAEFDDLSWLADHTIEAHGGEDKPADHVDDHVDKAEEEVEKLASEFGLKAPEKCPSCGKNTIQDNYAKNQEFKKLGKKPLPNWKCLSCGKKTWTKQYDWKAGKWIS